MTSSGRVERRGSLNGVGLRVAVMASRFNHDITERLLAGALDGLARHGVDTTTALVVWVPGAFELPLAALRVASSGEVDAVVCVGAVIRGDTDHYTHIATQCAAGLMQAQLATGIPVVFGVLTTDTVDDAMARAGGAHGNKGEEAAATAVEMADLLRRLSKDEGR